MPRYYFHIFRRGHHIKDHEGSDCADQFAAIEEGKNAARALLISAIQSQSQIGDDYIEVFDSEQVSITKILLKSVVPN